MSDCAADSTVSTDDVSLHQGVIPSLLPSTYHSRTHSLSHTHGPLTSLWSLARGSPGGGHASPHARRADRCGVRSDTNPVLSLLSHTVSQIEWMCLCVSDHHGKGDRSLAHSVSKLVRLERRRPAWDRRRRSAIRQRLRTHPHTSLTRTSHSCTHQYSHRVSNCSDHYSTLLTRKRVEAMMAVKAHRLGSRD